MKNKFATIRQAEKLASKICRNGTFKWLQAAAEDGFTEKKNIIDLNKIKIIPKQLNCIKFPEFSTSFFGSKITSPLILSPMGHQTQFHKNGEVEVAKSFEKINSIGFFGTQGRMSLNDIRKNNKKAKLGWTIFPFGNKEWILKQIRSSEDNNCSAISLCIDANIRSHRYLDRELLNYDARKFGKRTNEISPNPEYAMRYDWGLVRFIKQKTKIPLIIKGILTFDDAKNAIKNGADAIWISNHGGRMLNSGISGVDAILKIKNKIKSQKIKIIVDGGVRRGSDIIKYLCLGADFVGVGRPAMYGLICGGHLGVMEVFNTLNNELKTAMINGGFKNIKSFRKNRIIIDEKIK